MNDYIKKEILNGNLILFLGAGASMTSFNQDGSKLPLSNDLASDMADYFSVGYNGESLSILYSSLKSDHPNKMCEYFEKKFRFCTPSKEYQNISKLCWKRIYTINIDDALDVALQKSKQKINLCGMKSFYKNFDEKFERLDYIKLHGSVDRLHEGVIFSPEEYATVSANPHHWYEMIPSDFLESTILYIGTRMDEPSLLHMLNKYKIKFGIEFNKSFVITPHASEIEKKHLNATFNIEHIQGTIESFSEWLVKTIIIDEMTPKKLFLTRNPGYLDIDNFIKTDRRITDVNIFSRLLIINNNHFEKLPSIDTNSEQRFYHGMKPTWSEIYYDVPAKTERFIHIRDCILKQSTKDVSVITGQAGSGKTTMLMQLARDFSKQQHLPIYYADSVDKINDVVHGLNKIHKNGCFLFLERINIFKFELIELINERKISPCKIITAEKKNIWQKKCEGVLSGKVDVFDIGNFTDTDAKNILDKVEKYGRWTYLHKMKHEERIIEFIKRSHKQLLIALLEATHGKGFEDIIENDYDTLDTESERALLVLVGLFTINGYGIKESNAFKSLNLMLPDVKISNTLSNLTGIIYEERNKLYVRHPLYVEYIFNKFVDKKLLADSIVSLIRSFQNYESPYKSSMSTIEYNAYKNVLNNKFIRDKVKHKDIAISIYVRLEKQLSNDPHFWLQYGTLLKQYRKYNDAYDKVKTSLSISQNSYSLHSAAVLEIILSLSSSNRAISEELFSKAKTTLQTLDTNYKTKFDLYPIISLAEGEVKFTEKYIGTEEARSIAANYANEIARRKNEVPDKRLNSAWTALTQYRMKGVWTKTFLDRD